MAFTVTDFKSNLFAAAAAGGARPSLYKISITDSSADFSFSDTENILVKAAAVPAATSSASTSASSTTAVSQTTTTTTSTSTN